MDNPKARGEGWWEAVYLANNSRMIDGVGGAERVSGDENSDQTCQQFSICLILDLLWASEVCFFYRFAHSPFSVLKRPAPWARRIRPKGKSCQRRGSERNMKSWEPSGKNQPLAVSLRESERGRESEHRSSLVLHGPLSWRNFPQPRPQAFRDAI